MDNNMLERLTKSNVKLNIVKSQLTKNKLKTIGNKVELVSHMGTVVAALNASVSLLPKTYVFEKIEVSRNLRNLRNTAVSIIQSLNDKEITKDKAIIVARDINKRVKKYIELISSDIDTRSALATDLGQISNPVVLDKLATNFLASNKLKTVGNNFDVLQGLLDTKKDIQGTEPLLRAIQKAINPEVEIKNNPPVETNRISSSPKMDEGVLKIRTSLLRYKSKVPPPPAVSAEIKKDNFVIMTSPLVIYTTPSFSRQRLHNSGMKGEIITLSPGHAPYDAQGGVSMGNAQLFTVLENQIVLGVSSSLSIEDRTEIIDLAIFAAQNKYGKLVVIERGSPAKRLSEHVVKQNLDLSPTKTVFNTVENKIKLQPLVYEKPDEPSLPNKPTKLQREQYEKDIAEYRINLIKHKATNPPIRPMNDEPEAPIRPKKPKLLNTNTTKKSELKKIKQTNKQLEVDYEKDMEAYTKASAKYKKDLVNYNKILQSYPIAKKQHERALIEFQKMPEYKDYELQKQKVFNTQGKEVKKQNRQLDREHTREVSRMNVLQRNAFFADPHYHGILFIWLMREKDYSHFSGLHFTSIGFPYFTDISSRIEEIPTKEVVKNRQGRENSERESIQNLRQQRIAKNENDLKSLQPALDMIIAENKSINETLDKYKNEVNDNILQQNITRQTIDTATRELSNISDNKSAEYMRANLTLQQASHHLTRLVNQIEVIREVEIDLKSRRREVGRHIKELSDKIKEKLIGQKVVE